MSTTRVFTLVTAALVGRQSDPVTHRVSCRRNSGRNHHRHHTAGCDDPSPSGQRILPDALPIHEKTSYETTSYA
jgi:hypothetical protein